MRVKVSQENIFADIVLENVESKLDIIAQS